MPNNIISGEFDVHISATPHLSRSMRKLIKRQFGDGTNLPPGYDEGCVVAEDFNAELADGIIDANGTEFSPDPKIRARVGKNLRGRGKDGLVQFGLIRDRDGKRITLRWADQDYPPDVALAQVDHDEGEPLPAHTVMIDLGIAEVWETGNKAGHMFKRFDPRRNHDTGKDGEPYSRPPRRSHSRLCSADLKRLGIKQKTSRA